MRFVFALSIFLLATPLSSQAAVIINEVAWMGDSVSANHEWIELNNTGSSAVDVSGWILSDGMNFNVTLKGTVGAGQYAVLERTSEESAAGVAFMIYTGALVNTGTTLMLSRSDGGLEDQVAGGVDWQNIGGDNITKETAQYTSVGWVTGTPTPGAANSGTPNNDDENEEEDNSSSDDDEETTSNPPLKRVSRGEAVQLILPDMTLKLAVVAQKLGYVNQAIDFKVTPSGVGETLIDSLQYEWNFGDGTTALAKEPTHSYRYPGTYVVTVYGGYKRQEQVARQEITILPVSISLTVSREGDLQVNNDSPYEIDISSYVVNGGKEFIFPLRSVMLPNQTITLPRSGVGNPAVAEIRDAAGLGVLTTKVQKPDTPTTPTPAEKIIISTPTSVPEVETEDAQTWYAPLLLPEADDTLKTRLLEYLKPASVEAAPEIVATSTEPASRVPDAVWPYLGLIGVILLGLFGTAKKFSRNQS
ncbi:MAG: lamin tail domain-containing protein [Patescibacteria group bacterium]